LSLKHPFSFTVENTVSPVTEASLSQEAMVSNDSFHSIYLLNIMNRPQATKRPTMTATTTAIITDIKIIFIVADLSWRRDGDGHGSTIRFVTVSFLMSQLQQMLEGVSSPHMFAYAVAFLLGYLLNIF
jgi:hypothetical protein